ncbi:hypothetical protein [Nocardioides sp.]|uniref:hypothetical protein n=1 Tax=Nocardioides sp. TaxID=35761 RepID=UPI002721BE6C|nr:hypothetical protein [Nocardioides sp.]MDO9454984.1 hypothetical protein [Nocardioides sp.]
MRKRDKPIVIRVHANRIGLVPPLRLFPQNATGPTRGDVRRDRWRRSSYGLWAPPWADATRVEQRIVEAGANLKAFGGVTGWAALRWLGCRWCDGVAPDGSLLPVVLAADDMRTPSNAVLSEERLNPRDLVEVDGLVITLPVRSVIFEMRYASSVREAVVWFEKAAYDDLVTIEEAWDYVTGYLNGWTGVPQVRLALVLVVENSWSPQETRLRLVWIVDAGLPPPLCNRPVFDLEGRHLGTPDLIDVEAGLIVQYDGPDHLEPGQHAYDEAQDIRYLEHGLGVVRVTRHDMRDRARLAVRLEEARDEALAHPAPREWTVDLPDWWVPTFTVAQRRALDAEQQAAWLRYRQPA